jgi:thymidylate kinase
MKTLIFEGIATSGKSTVTTDLIKTLKNEMKVVLAAEEQTHEPIMNQKNELNTLFFKDLINKLTRKNPDLIIFDRLYLTQADRAKSDLAKYSSVEEALLPYSPHTIILKVNEAAIANRLKTTAEHRGQEWVEKFWRSKGNTYEEIAKYYIDQQRGLLQLVTQSKLPYTVFDTTNHDYDAIVEEIQKIVRK